MLRSLLGILMFRNLFICFGLLFVCTWKTTVSLFWFGCVRFWTGLAGIGFVQHFSASIFSVRRWAIVEIVLVPGAFFVAYALVGFFVVVFNLILVNVKKKTTYFSIALFDKCLYKTVYVVVFTTCWRICVGIALNDLWAYSHRLFQSDPCALSSLQEIGLRCFVTLRRLEVSVIGHIVHTTLKGYK